MTNQHQKYKSSVNGESIDALVRESGSDECEEQNRENRVSASTEEAKKHFYRKYRSRECDDSVVVSLIWKLNSLIFRASCQLNAPPPPSSSLSCSS